jgi:hypothetical protein
MQVRWLLYFVAVSCWASATDIYVASSAAGAQDGSSCANAKVYTFFNSSGNWGSGSTQIGPGTTVHICGTITGGTAASLFQFQSSGTSGNPVTLKFEANAILQAPYFALGSSASGGISGVSGLSYITIDGGTNGLIQSTLNGSSGATCPGGTCTNQQDAQGIYFTNITNLTVKNLQIGPMYVRVNTESTSGASTCIYLDNQSHSGAANILVQNNNIHDCGDGIFYFFGTNDGTFELASNTMSSIDGDLRMGGNSGTNINLSGLKIHDNDFSNWSNWDDENIGYHNHHEALQVYGGNPGLANCYIWNNYVHGSFGNGTAPGFYLDNNANGSGTYHCTLFNNLFYVTNAVQGDAAITGQNEGGGPVVMNVYNNTILAPNYAGVGAVYFHSTNVTGDLRNNVITGYLSALWIDGSALLPTTSDYNDWYQFNNGTVQDDNNSNFYTLAQWQTFSSLDAHSIASNPNLNNTTYHPNSGSPAIGLGQNLTSLCTGVLVALCTDKAGVARPASGNWDAGAFQFQPPPSGISIFE